MDGGLPKSAESLEAVGNGSKGAGNDGSNGAGPGSDVQGGGAVGVIVRQRELSGDRGDSQGPGVILPLGGATDHGDDVKTRGRRRVGVPLGSGGNGSRGAPPHGVVHQEAAGKLSGKGGMPPHL